MFNGKMLNLEIIYQWALEGHGHQSRGATISPECISSETLTRCLLQTLSITEEQDRQCWQEFDDIIANSARCVEPAPGSVSFPPGRWQ